VKIFSCPVREARRPLSLTGLVAPESRSADNTIMGSWRSAGGAYLEVYRLRKNSLLSCSRSLKWSVSESGGSFDESLRRFDRRLFDRPAARFGVPLSCHRRIYLDGRTETHREPIPLPRVGMRRSRGPQLLPSRNSKEHGFGIDPSASRSSPNIPGNTESTQVKSALNSSRLVDISKRCSDGRVISADPPAASAYHVITGKVSHVVVPLLELS
jgi:hypothetical protein